jgi:hypothetical protein
MAEINKDILNKVLALLEKGVFAIGLITIVLTGVCVYLWVNQLPLDETLKTSWLMVMGFFFGSGASYSVARVIKALIGEG